MATVLMKWLETSPQKYQRGIHLLTLGRIARIHRRIASEYVRPGMQVLEIGCGTGSLCVQMAQQGAQVTGIDLSPQMLGEASQQIARSEVADQISLKLMDAALVGEVFPPGQFDLIVASFSLSEMPRAQQQYLLLACRDLLAEGGTLLIADEVRPKSLAARMLYQLVRLLMQLLTWLLTRTTTHPIDEAEDLLRRTGFRVDQAAAYLGGSLVLLAAQPGAAPRPAAVVIGHLEHRVTLKTRLKDVMLLFNRLIPPYPKVQPGVYSLGRPDAQSPVVVTGNFDLTVRRLVKALDGRADLWVLVVDTAGINVWCAAGGGFFTAEKVAAALRVSRLDQIVSHHALILPQLAACGVDGWKLRSLTGWGVYWGPVEAEDLPATPQLAACGVDGWKLRSLTGWGVYWGPVEAEDLPAYLSSGRKKDAAMRQVEFPLRSRLEMVTVTLSFYALVILLPVLVFWRPRFWPVTFSLLGLAYVYAVVHPRLPGKEGLEKSIPLALCSLAGFWVYLQWAAPMGVLSVFGWALGLTGLSVFTAAEMQGMSPHMRGEQANWLIEAVIFVVLGLVYWVVPLLAGWR